MRYKISPHIEFNTVQAHINGRLNEEALVVTDKNSDTSFFINASIKTFIQKFEIPKTFKELTEEVSNELSLAVSQVKKIIKPFFNYCKYRHFILPERKQIITAERKPLFKVNSIVDAYKIEDIIDVSIDMDIYKAVDINTEASVIIKLLKKVSKENNAALKREYNFLMFLNNENVTPQALAFRRQKNYTYFVQEFIDGLSLPQFINRSKNLSQKDATAIAKKIINAFAEIHDKGIVHGDIHPGNIIITLASTIKVLDFGLALNHSSSKNAEVNFGGAYFFMPPERIKKTTYKKFTTPPNFSSDVFQLGVVLFKLFYNAYPFNGVTWEELATEIKEKDIIFRAKASYGFDVDENIKQIIKKCVAKKPGQRFVDATAIQAAFIVKKSNHAHTLRSAIEI